MSTWLTKKATNFVTNMAKNVFNEIPDANKIKEILQVIKDDEQLKKLMSNNFGDKAKLLETGTDIEKKLAQFLLNEKNNKELMEFKNVIRDKNEQNIDEISKEITANNSKINQTSMMKTKEDAAKQENSAVAVSQNENYGNVFDIDSYINSALYSTIIVLIYLILVITIAFVFVNAFMNYAIFCYYTIREAILESDEYNLSKIKLRETYRFNLLNYVFCKNKSDEDDENKIDISKVSEVKSKKKDCEENTTMEYINYMINILSPLDNCDAESHLNIYGGNKLFNAVMKIIYLILLILFLGTISYIIINIFLGGLRRYKIIGSNMFSYVYQKGAVYIYVLLLVFFYCLAHSMFFKYMFIDNVYTRIYTNYIEAIKPDAYVHGEIKAIENEKDFVNLLSKSTFENIDVEYELNVHNKKIIENIRLSSNNDIKASKIFLYAVYIYFKRQNDDDIDIINKLNSIILQKPENKETLIGLLLTELNGIEMASEFNNIITNIGIASTTVPATDQSETAKKSQPNEFEGFDFNNISSYAEINLNYKVAYKISKLYEILLNASDNIDFGSAIYYLNMFLVLEWFMNAIFMLLFLLVLYYNSDDDPLFKQLINYIVAVILIIIDELKTGLIGI